MLGMKLAISRPYSDSTLFMPPSGSYSASDAARTRSSIPATRISSFVRSWKYPARGWIAVPWCFSIDSTSTPCWARNIAVARPTMLPPTTTTGTSMSTPVCSLISTSPSVSGPDDGPAGGSNGSRRGGSLPRRLRMAREQVREFVRAAERDAVAGRDLVGRDRESVGDNVAHEVRWEEAVLGAEHEPGRHIWQRVEWPRHLVRGVRLTARSTHRLLGELARNVVVEGDEGIVVPGRSAVSSRLVLDGLSVSRVLPPVSGGLARCRDHAGHEDQQVDGTPIGDEWRRESAVRLRNDDHVLAIPDRIDHGVRVPPEVRRVVIAGQVRSDRLVSELVQGTRHEMPVPADVTAAMNERESGHS